MIINNIILDNFQSYYARNRFSFGKGVNIVSGKNGSGKSKLFNGFYYVLFRSVYSEIQGDGWYIPNNYQLTELVNQRTKHLCRLNEEINCVVSLELTTMHYSNKHHGEVLYIFERGFKIRKSGKEQFELSQGEQFKIEIKLPNGETEHIPSNDLNYILSEIFPSEIRRYMWFQGETINELLDFKSGEALKEAVKNISYYPIYERVEQICLLASEKNDSEQKKVIRKLSKNQDEILDLTLKIESLKKKIKENSNDLDENSKIVNERTIDLNRLEENKDRLIKIEEARRNLEKHYERRKNATDRQGETRSYFKNRYAQVWMFYGLEENFKQLGVRLYHLSDQLLESLDIRNPVPYFIPGADHIQRCITDEICHFCERDAKIGSQAFISLQKRLEDLDKFDFERVNQKNLFKEKSETLTVLRENANGRSDLDSNIDADIELNEKKYAEAYTEYVKSSLAIKELDEEIKHNASLAGANDAVKALNLIRLNDNQIRSARAKIDRFQREQPMLQIEFQKHQKRFQELSEIIDEKNPNVIAAKHFNVLVRASKILKNQAEVKLINDIVLKSNEIYGNFLKSSGAPQGRISIENYEVEIKDGDRLIDINKGHYTVAKMSVINAVLSLSATKLGKSYPLITDAPSSVFDVTNVTSYTENICKEFEQVIIMSKDYSEPSVMSALLRVEDISNIYEIENTQVTFTQGAPLYDYEIKIKKLR